MRLQNYKRLNTSDFPKEQQKTIEDLGNSLNPGIEALYQALNKRLTVKDNFQATEKDLDIQVNSGGIPTADSFANVDFGSQVRTVTVGKVDNLSNSTNYPSSAVMVSWTNTQSGIQINHVTGLSAGNSYRIRLIMYG